VTAWSKASVCGCWFAGIAVSNTADYIDVSISLVIVVWCQVVVFATDPSLVQGSPTECHVSL